MRRYKQMDIAKRTSRTMKDYPQHYERLKSLIGQLREVRRIAQGRDKSGAIDTKTKELIALGIAVAVRCDGCIAFHVNDALEAGAERG